MKPLIFISSTQFKVKLRDYVQDLNQDMNFEEIIDFFMKNILDRINKNPNNSKRLISLMLQLHGEKEFREILRYNIKALGIHFSHVDAKASVISGNSWHLERDPDGEKGFLDWLFFDYFDWDQPEVSINQNEMDQLNDLEDGVDDDDE